MDKNVILEHLRKFIESKKDSTDKKTEQLISVLRQVRAEMLMISKEPTYFCAQMECNSTGVGESSFQGTTTQRTVSLDYVTPNFLFIDGDLDAGKKGLELFHLKEGETISFFAKSDMENCAKRDGFLRHQQNFRDLNISLTDHRLNRFAPLITKKPFSYPIRAITALLSEKGDKLLIGYIYEYEGAEYILIEPGEVKKPAGLFGFQFKPWMIIFLFCPLLWLAIPFIIYGKYKAKQMTGF